MEGDQGQTSTPVINLTLRTVIVGTVELIFGACLLIFHVLNAIKIIETRELLGYVALFLPDDEKTSHQGYHIASSILASIMISFSFVLFWGIFNYKENLVWAWILSNGMLCIVYGFLGVYGLILRYVLFTIENIVVIGFIIVFLVAVYPYYKWLCVRNIQSRRVVNDKQTTSKKRPN